MSAWQTIPAQVGSNTMHGDNAGGVEGGAGGRAAVAERAEASEVDEAVGAASGG